MKFIFLLTICIVASRLALFAQPGTLDLTFGINTHITTDISYNYRDFANAAVRQPDGKIVLVGAYSFYDSYWGEQFSYFALVRYLSNGEPDSTFGGDGKIKISAVCDEAEANSILIQPDGKIVAGGSGIVNCENSDFMLARFNADGSNDNSFGSSGKVTTDLDPDESDGINSIALQSDNKIVAVGYSGLDDSDFSIARYNPDGSLDVTFGIEGILLVDFNGEYSVANAVVIQSDGKIVVAGYAEDDIALIRLLPDGLPDATFGINGKVITDVPSTTGFISCAAIQSNGKIVVAGNYDDYSQSKFLVVRYSGEGVVDSSFAENGFFILDIPNDGEAISSLQIQPDGRLVVGGYWNNYGTNPHRNFAVARIKTSGALDNTFGEDGVVVYDFAGFYDRASSIVLEPDDKIIVAGSASVGSDYDFAWIRLNADGSINNFPPDGKVTLSFAEDVYDFGHKILIQPDDKILEIGHTYIFNKDYFAISRFLPDGLRDTSFGIGGRITHAFSSTGNEAYSGALQPDGKIIVYGTASYWEHSIVVARLNTDGSLDSTFGNDGVVKYVLGDEEVEARDIALQPDGKILAAAAYEEFGTNTLIRFNSDGSVDSSFGNYGEILLESQIYAVAIQPDGKILLAGKTVWGTYGPDFVLYRFLLNGTLDNTFGSSGKVSTDFGNFIVDCVHAVMLQSDGKIVCAGTVDPIASYSMIGLVRYKTNGEIDPDFGVEGKVTTSNPDTDLEGFAALLLPDHKIVVAGSVESDFVLVKYHNNGGIDQSFGSQG
ncbi:MAG: hypothetical protein WBB36_11740, partial [Chitinophagales bacterium]